MGERWEQIRDEFGVESWGEGSNKSWVPAKAACKRIAALEAERDNAIHALMQDRAEARREGARKGIEWSLRHGTAIAFASGLDVKEEWVAAALGEVDRG